MLGYYIVKLFSKLMCIAPACVRNGIAAFLGWVAVKANPAWRMKMAVANIQECLGLGEAEAKQIAEDSLKRFGRMIVEVMRFPLLKPENIDQLVKIEGRKYLDAAYDEGKGFIVCTGHYGNWELLGATVALHKFPIISITRKQNNSKMDQLINEFREMVGQKVAYNRGTNSMLTISRMLKDKNVIGILYDQDTNDVGVEIDLFGKKSIIPFGAAALSRTYGAPILPMFMHNNADGTCTLRIHPVIHTAKTKNKEQDFYDATKILVNVLEQEIKADPAMWFWVHDRWKDGRQRFGGEKKHHRH